jgi:hypothetical protein
MSQILLVFAFLWTQFNIPGEQCVAKLPAQCQVHGKSQNEIKCKFDFFIATLGFILWRLDS